MDADTVKAFVASPSTEVLDTMKKVDLLAVCKELNVRARASMRKDHLKSMIVEHFVDEEELEEHVLEKYKVVSDVSEREYLEHELRLKHLEMEEKQRDRELQLQLRKLELEAEQQRSENTRPTATFDPSRHVRLVPPFNEKEVDKYFQHFEKVASNLEWPTKSWPLLLQSVIKGKAQEAYSALSLEDSGKYEVVKAAILKAYELVPEAYRQKFRNYRKFDNQTHVEFAYEKAIYFERWCTSKKVNDSFEDLKQLVLVEEFKRCVRDDVKTYLDEKDVETLQQAATLADDFALTHKNKYLNVKQRGPPRGVSGGGSSSQAGESSGPPHFERSSPAPAPRFSSGHGDQSRTNVTTRQSGQGQPRYGPICHYCKRKGHVISECWTLKNRRSTDVSPNALVSSHKSHYETHFCRQKHDDPDFVVGKSEPVREEYLPFVSEGCVSRSENDSDSVPIKILRDTGATQSLMLQDALPVDSQSATGESILAQGIECSFVTVPLHKVYLRSDLVTGFVTVGVRPTLPVKGVSLLLGNDLAGSQVIADPCLVSKPVTSEDSRNEEVEISGLFPACAVTRAMAKKALEKDKTSLGEDFVGLSKTFMSQGEGYDQPSFDGSPRDTVCEVSDRKDDEDYELTLSQSELRSQQESDPEIIPLLKGALPEVEIERVPVGYYLKRGILMRKWRPVDIPANEEWAVVHQIVVPKRWRKEIMRVAHDVSLAGHLGINKTCGKIMTHFFWPGLRKDVSEYCKTCHTCQMVGKPNVKIPCAPLSPIPAFEEPFSRVIIDCVGPLPKTRSGNEYLLTIMCASTRFPEAIPLRSINARNVSKSLLKFFTLFGLPKEIQSDQGSNFMSGLFQQVVHQLGAKQIKSSAYHPQSQGALERFHSTLKTMIKTYSHENGKDWDEGIPFLLFAVRESVQESLGFSPFELVFGHTVRGPLKLIKETWLSEESGNLPLLDYVSEFKERLSRACELAHENLRASQHHMKTWYDKKAKERSFSPGDKVLVLLPIKGQPLQAKFHGPCDVVRKEGNLNYVIATPDRRKATQMCHINMLKPYYERNESSIVASVSETSDSTDCCPSDHRPCITDNRTEKDSDVPVRVSNSDILANLDTKLSHLNAPERDQLTNLIHEYKQIFPDVPNKTNVLCHDVDVGEATPIKQHPYRVNPVKAKQMDAEIEYMLKHDIIQPSQSEWSSPCVLIPKPGGSVRFCTDFRKVNAVSRTDSFPIPRVDDCIDRIGKATYVTKCDLLKGYWGVPLTNKAREISAFVTPDGFYEYKVMPFGMKNAPATFTRLISKVIHGLKNVEAYIDDLIVYSDNWEEHLERLRQVFDRLSQANLTVNLSKSEFVKAKVTYLGHVVGQGVVAPVEARIEAIVNYPTPKNVTGLRRFLGMSGFYRKFCKNYSQIAVPLTDLTKKNTKFSWGPECDKAFNQLKAILWNVPVLKAPDFGKAFKLAVDACDLGAGAVLLQEEDDGVEHPVCYFSKKFDCHQRNYSTIEKELLALVLALQHFDVYINPSADAITVYTDHNPLTFLHRMRNKNRRLLNWSLLLQEYNLNITHIKGRDNVIADALSRAV